MSFSTDDDRPLTRSELQAGARARLPDLERVHAENEAAFLAAPRGSTLAAETWRARSASARNLAETRELADPHALTPHRAPDFSDLLREGMANAPLSPFARLGAELQAMSVPHYPREGAAVLDALSDEERDQLDFVVKRLGAHAAAELELGRGMHAAELAELAAGRGPRDGILLAKIARGLPRAVAVAQGQPGTSRFKVYNAEAAAEARKWLAPRPPTPSGKDVR